MQEESGSLTDEMEGSVFGDTGDTEEPETTSGPTAIADVICGALHSAVTFGSFPPSFPTVGGEDCELTALGEDEKGEWASFSCPKIAEFRFWVDAVDEPLLSSSLTVGEQYAIEWEDDFSVTGCRHSIRKISDQNGMLFQTIESTSPCLISLDDLIDTAAFDIDLLRDFCPPSDDFGSAHCGERSPLGLQLSSAVMDPLPLPPPSATADLSTAAFDYRVYVGTAWQRNCAALHHPEEYVEFLYRRLTD